MMKSYSRFLMGSVSKIVLIYTLNFASTYADSNAPKSDMTCPNGMMTENCETSMKNCTGTDCNMNQRGNGPKQGMMMFGANNTHGWAMMTETERAEHRLKMLSFKTAAECKSYVKEHHEKMSEKASSKGLKLPAPRRDPCDQMMANRKKSGVQ